MSSFAGFGVRATGLVGVVLAVFLVSSLMNLQSTSLLGLLSFIVVAAAVVVMVMRTVGRMR